MKSYIQDWLGSALGIVFDMKADNFGKHARDGKILAKLLYSYGALPLEIYNDIKPSKNINDCYNNLLRLKPWLEYLDVPVQDELLYKIACNQETASIHLFYALYLSLKNKDKLHYLAIQKVKKYSEHWNKRKIKVDWVPEKDIRNFNVEHESDLAIPLIEKQPIIDWHREKCNEILENIKCAKKNFIEATQEKKTKLGPVISKNILFKRTSAHESEMEKTRNDLNAFADKHISFSQDLNYDELVALQNKVALISPKITPNLNEAKRYLNLIKKKSKRETLINDFQEQMHWLMVNEMWNDVKNKQEQNFEELVTEHLLKQSQYEKQISCKLALVRNQKNILLKNRLMIENLKITHLEKEFNEDLNHKMDLDAEFDSDENFEKLRISELHKRIYMEKVRLKFEERLDEAKSILDKLIDITLRICDFRESFACEIPKHVMKDMKELFFKDQPIFDILESLEDLYSAPAYGKHAEAREGEEGEEGVEEEEEEEDEDEEEAEGDDDQTYEEDYVAEDDSKERTDLESRETLSENDELDSMKAVESLRQEVLNESDFNDYTFLLGPWTLEFLFAGEAAAEPRQKVLGHVVHRVLECKYPPLSMPAPANIKPMSFRSIVQADNDESVFRMLSDLMGLRKVVVVRVDDAINFVLNAYKEEVSLARDVDVAFQQATKSAMRDKAKTERAKEVSRKELLIKEETPLQQKGAEEEPKSKEMAVQTPRNIPEDDSLLSRNAEIGRAAFEAMGIGDPIPDIIVIYAIIAYVISVEKEYEGWVLWNYPVLYSQASKLECALTGYELMNVENAVDTVERIEGFECRTDCQNPKQRDEFESKRVSKLVPKPEASKIPLKAQSYFGSFIKLQNKGNPSKNALQLQGADHIQKFYSEQNAFYAVDFTAMSFDVVKDVGKIILGESKANKKIVADACSNVDDARSGGDNNNNGDNPSGSGADLREKTSVEIFGEGLVDLDKKYNPPKKKSEKEAKKPSEMAKVADSGAKPPPSNASEDKGFEKEKKTFDGTNDSSSNRDPVKSPEASDANAAPGEPGWKWATGQQKEEMLLALATFWENLEAIFVEDFKTFSFCLRAHKANTYKYIAFLKKALRIYMRQEDAKQAILSQFQQRFNDIDDDLRPDFDVKCELHVRVTELEEVMYEIADERKDKLEEHRIKFARDQWTADEMANLVNLYLRALQLEADRCIDTCQFINDYYLSLQQKIPQDGVLQKVALPKLSTYGRQHSITSAMSKNLNLSYHPRSNSNMLFKSSRSSVKQKSKMEHGKVMYAPSKTIHSEATALEGGAEAISDILVSLVVPENCNTPFHAFYLDAVEGLRSAVKGTVDSCMAEVRRGDRDRGPADGGRDKKKTPDYRSEGGSNLHLEWVAALDSELERFLFRMRLIQVRGIVDFNEFILLILNTLAALSHEIGDIYNREQVSIGECAKLFRCAIEREIAIQPRLEMNIDEFVVNRGFPLFPTSAGAPPASQLPEESNEFTVEQLSIIFRKLQCIAPRGEIIRRAFLYILEDLRVMKCEDGVPRLLPNLWDSLNPNDLPHIFDQVYQRMEIVNWKDFIIYASDLPMPSESELLSMRFAFRSFDPSNTELISHRDYQKVDFWFEARGNFDPGRGAAMRELLFKMYQVNEELTNYTALLLACCKDRTSSGGFVKALSLCIGKEIAVGSQEELPWDEGEGAFDKEEDLMRAAESVQSQEEGADVCGQKQCAQYSCKCKYSAGDGFPGEEEQRGEGYDSCFGVGECAQMAQTSEIPRDALMKVLISSYPIHSQLSVLFRCRKTLEQTVDDIFEALSPDGARVKAYKLLKHKFIVRLLGSTNKFKTVDLRGIVMSKVSDTNGNLQSPCSTLEF